MTEPLQNPSEPTRADYIAAQKRRNVWLALALVAFVALVGITSVVRISTTDYSKSDGFYLDGKIPAVERSVPAAPSQDPVPAPETGGES